MMPSTSSSRSASPVHHRHMHHMRKHHKRSSTPEFRQQQRRSGQLRRSSLPHDFRTEPCLLNASWENGFDRKSAHKRSTLQQPEWLRSLPTTKFARSSSQHNHNNTRRPDLINNDELKSLTLCLWTTTFAGTVDPRFHSEYLPAGLKH